MGMQEKDQVRINEHPRILTPDDDHIGQNMYWDLLKKFKVLKEMSNSVVHKVAYQ
jgi:hypothetical protein